MAWLATCLVLAASGCHHRDEGEGLVVTSSTCIRCQPAVVVGALQSKEMDETSGIASSSTGDGVYFAHNDSGDVARFFAIDEQGARLAAFTFSPAPVVDCEDIARGPCDAGGASCLYVADIGDNTRQRGSITIYRVKEPLTIADATVSSDRLALRYPDGAHDAETLLVHPRTGVLTIVTKEKAGGASTVYEAPMPLTPGVLVTLLPVGTLRSPAGSPRFTGGSVHPEARGILLRTYTHVFFAPMRPEQTVAEALRAPLCSLPIAHEDQGEAIAWLRAGKGFLTVGEGIGASVNLTRCEGPGP